MIKRAVFNTICAKNVFAKDFLQETILEKLNNCAKMTLQSPIGYCNVYQLKKNMPIDIADE